MLCFLLDFGFLTFGLFFLAFLLLSLLGFCGFFGKSFSADSWQLASLGFWHFGLWFLASVAGLSNIQGNKANNKATTKTARQANKAKTFPQPPPVLFMCTVLPTMWSKTIATEAPNTIEKRDIKCCKYHVQRGRF